jgi:uncharacterized protein with FMN-binding domain
MNETKDNKSKKLVASLALFLLAVVIVATVVISRPKDNMSSTTPVAATTKTTATSSSSSTTYKDGTYTATGSYDSPAGTEKVKVTLTLASNTVTAANVISETNDPTAQTYQSIFISGYKSHVVGKKINTIKLSNVSGSSLTSQGFNDALKQIEQQATA